MKAFPLHALRAGLVLWVGTLAVPASGQAKWLYPTNAAGTAVRLPGARSVPEFTECHAFVPQPDPHREALISLPAGDGALVSYRAFDGSNYLMRQFLGKFTALYISPPDLDTFTLDQAREMVDLADVLYAAFTEFMGTQPTGSGLLKMAFVKTCGAGCGYVGWKGVEFDPGYVEGTVAELTGVLVHEMTHNFDRWSSHVMYEPDIGHAWTDFMSFYLRVADRAGSSSRHPEDLLQYQIDEYFGPYLDYPGSTWETCVRDAACAGVSAQHAQGGLALRLAQLHGVAATQRALYYLRDVIAARGLNPASMTALQRNDLLIECFSYGARTNLSCYLDLWRWPISTTLRSQLATAYGSINLTCADQDNDTYSIVQGDGDDREPGIHPGAVELVNGLDDDCNGLVDDVLFTEAGDFPNTTGASFALPLPARVQGELAASDGDFFNLNLAAETRVRFTLRARDGAFKGWVFLYHAGGGWQDYFYVGGGAGSATYVLPAGRWNFGVELNSVSAPGAYELTVQTGYEWPVLVYPPAPVNLASNRWRLSTPPVPGELSGAGHLRARFWVSGFGWMATNAVPDLSGTSVDWLAPSGTDLTLTRVRVQFFDGDLAAWRVTESTPFLSNAPPVVVITAPVTGSAWPLGSNLTITASVTDPEGALRWVNFYQGAVLLGSFTNGPYALTLSNLAAGTYSFKVVATDHPGATVASAPVNLTVSRDRVLIGAGAVWKYLDTGVDQGTAWRGPNFNDSAWLSGPAQLGYGDDDEATTVGFGPDPDSKFITTYFRHAFVLSDARSLSNLTVLLLRDDGGAVYLNGTEVFRDNLPSGTISFSTRASSSATPSDESTNFHSAGINPALLVNGTNVVAVEIHQDSSGSSDLSFDLTLVAGLSNAPPVVAVTNPPNGAVFLAPANFTLMAAARDPDGVLTRVELYRNVTKIADRVNPPYNATVSSLPVGTYAFTVRATDHNGTVSTSAVVQVSVVTGTALTFIPAGDTWKYLDDGSDAGTAWPGTHYNDGGWRSGRAQLGYGDGDEITLVRSNRLDNTRIITTYFRRAFTVAEAPLIRSLTARLLRDDGGVAYLNGFEVFRSHMDTGIVTYTTRANNTVNDPEEDYFYSYSIDPSLLRTGTNVLAVEIHQVSSSSSDISFDFELTGLRVNPGPPTLAVRPDAAEILLSWSSATSFRLLCATNLTPPATWTPAPEAVVRVGDECTVRVSPPAVGNRFYRLQWP